MAGPEHSERLVGFPLYNNTTLVDFAGASQVFAAPGAGYKPIWIARDLSPVTTTEGVSVLPHDTFDNCPELFMLFVPGGGALDHHGEEKDGGVVATMFDDTYLDFLRTASQTATWTGSVCTGAFLLAAAGLLKDVSATTYWSVKDVLGLMSGHLIGSLAAGYEPSHIVAKDKRFTGGGISSSIDLAFDLITEIDGIDTANAAQLMVQFQPNPNRKSGRPGPGYASPQLVEALIGKQQPGFIKPLESAVKRLLQSV